MTKIVEQLVWKLNQLFPPLTVHRELELAKRSVEANQSWALKEARRIVTDFEPYWDIRDQHLLDIGTGLGGKLPFFVESGAKTVTGIDINPDSITTAKQHVQHQDVNSKEGHGKIRLLVCDAARLPFPDSTFDAIVSINVFEHIAYLELAIRETMRVLKPGCLVYLHLPPYYSPWGPHLENWIHFPWPHLFFSDRVLMRVAAREDEQRRLTEQFVEAARIDWQGAGDRIPDVNHVTLRDFRRMVLQAGFAILQLNLLPFGYDSLRNATSLIKRMLFYLLKLSTKLPLVQEVTVTKMVYVLRKY